MRDGINPGRCGGFGDYTLNEVELLQAEGFQNQVATVRFSEALEYYINTGVAKMRKNY